jgi:dipeptidyl-peptidase-4
VGDGYIARAGWLPDGEGAWFQVLNRDQTRIELRTAAPGAASSRLLVADEAPTWINVRDDLVFVGNDRFVWSSERDGWRHLYLYAVDGSLIRRLTRGAWQVEKVYGLDGDGSHVVYQSNQADHRERHLYSVALVGGEPRQLVSSSGTHSAFLAPDGRHFVGRFSNVTTPDRLDLYTVGGDRLATIDDGDIPALKGLETYPPEYGTIESADGDTLHTMMFKPPGFDSSEKYPVLVYVYGGPGAQLVVNRWGSTRFLFMQYLARKGLIIFSVDNRGSWGRGHAFEAHIHRRLGEIELRDQVAGVEFLKRQPWVDPERIGVYGGSYGGYMTLVAMNRAPEHFKVGIAYAPVTDWRLYDTIYTERYMDTPQDNPEGYRDSAPLNHAEGLGGRLLICHGTMDNNVHFQQSIQMADRYVKAGKLIEMMVYPRTRHGIRLSANRVQFHTLKEDFLERYLIEDGD